MQVHDADLYALLYPQHKNGRRYTQDTPILAEVWLKLAKLGPKENRVDVLLNPHNQRGVGSLMQAIAPRFDALEHRLAYNESHIVVDVTLKELLEVLLPQSNWWHKLSIRGHAKDAAVLLDQLAKAPDLTIEQWSEFVKKRGRAVHPTDADLIQLFRIATATICMRLGEMSEAKYRRERSEVGKRVRASLLVAIENVPEKATLWTVSRNRPAIPALWKSRETIKADAAIRVFNVKCDDICWAVIDSGIDATHPAFARHAKPKPGESPTRVIATYDFTRLRELLCTPTEAQDNTSGPMSQLSRDERKKIKKDLRDRLLNGLNVDWDTLKPLLEVPHNFEVENSGKPASRAPRSKDKKIPYAMPPVEHGTHVAGILGADWTDATMSSDDVVVQDVYDYANIKELNARQILRGICPDILLYDFRVFDASGSGDEFALLAALQFARYLNASKSKRVIHGINISISLEHNVRSYACGRTPVCDECERAVGSGLVVVAAAGNTGFDENQAAFASSYRQSSITDPGNADGVITVGATHREMPHTYGVSYFSSRGPTGDGRAKPDLVAPGERIFSAIPDKKAATLDGTSMAAPHVSGAAALLMARHSELIGEPVRIKKILCSTATDLGRVPQYQGTGLVDVLRALESV